MDKQDMSDHIYGNVDCMKKDSFGSKCFIVFLLGSNYTFRFKIDRQMRLKIKVSYDRAA